MVEDQQGAEVEVVVVEGGEAVEAFRPIMELLVDEFTRARALDWTLNQKLEESFPGTFLLNI